jgi:hypothetical protein
MMVYAALQVTAKTHTAFKEILMPFLRFTQNATLSGKMLVQNHVIIMRIALSKRPN